MSNISINLKLLRNEAGLSFEELSEKTGINVILLEAFETEKCAPNEYQLEVLCKVLKIPSDEIGERNLVLERKQATNMMKSRENRNNYNWYFGNKKKFIFYLSYIIYFVLAVSLLSLYYIHKFEGVTLELLRQEWITTSAFPFPVYVFLFYYTHMSFGISLFGLGVGVFMVIDYFTKHTFYFRWWYIFWISFFITCLEIIGILGSIPYLIYVIIKIIKRKY
ncbi:MAG: hypothetical protein IKC22_06030 [Bacilli bacterium]|nr:hypothetical protein [Bacilli bacterium]